MPTCNINGRPRMTSDEDKEERTIVIYGDVDDVMKEKLSKNIIAKSIYLMNKEVMAERLFQD